MTSGLRIGARQFEAGGPTQVVAELGLSHQRVLDRALQLVALAADAGVNAVTCDVHPWTADLVVGAREQGLAVIGVPNEIEDLDVLRAAGVDAIKVASGDLTWPALIAGAAHTGLPVLLSTGMADEADITAAVSAASAARHLVLLHSVSAYPVPPGFENLAAIRTMREHFGLPTGLSDHGAERSTVAMAVALGACVYERHLFVPDPHEPSDVVGSSPEEFVEIVIEARRARAALGDGHKRCQDIEIMHRHLYRRALVAARDLEAGTTIQAGDLRALRPAAGLPPAAAVALVGQTMRVGRLMGEPIRTHDAMPSAVGA